MSLRAIDRKAGRSWLVSCLGVALLLESTGCAQAPGSRTQQGAVLGGLAGATAGVLAAGEGDNLAGGLIGGAAGALAGGLLGRYLDNQSREIDAIPDATV
jgi:hypothetical protein